MNILHCAAIQWERISGPSASVPGLVAAQNRCAGVRAALVTTHDKPGQPTTTAFPVFAHHELLAGAALPEPWARPDLAVFHSTYIPAHGRLAERFRALGVPYLICPRGGMTDHAQQYRGWKKRLGNWTFFNKLVAGASALHCLTQGEAEEIRTWSLPRLVAGNGIDAPPAMALASPGEAASRRLIFVGRLATQHKGLDLLLAACALARVRLRQCNPRIELYGPDHRGDAAWLRQRIHELHLEPWVSLCGPIVGDAKRVAFQAGDVFLHTSRWEGLPMAVLEALAHGLPCLLTPATNMADEVQAAGAGWRAVPTPIGVAAALEKSLLSSAAELRTMSAAARRLCLEHYSWDHIAQRTVEQYRHYAARPARRQAA